MKRTKLQKLQAAEERARARWKKGIEYLSFARKQVNKLAKDHTRAKEAVFKQLFMGKQVAVWNKAKTRAIQKTVTWSKDGAMKLKVVARKPGHQTRKSK